MIYLGIWVYRWGIWVRYIRKNSPSLCGEKEIIMSLPKVNRLGAFAVATRLDDDPGTGMMQQI